MSAYSPDTELVRMGSLSLVLIGPDEKRRQSIAQAVAGPEGSVARELTDYPGVDDLPELLEADHDAIIIDLDPDPERALDVVENVCGANTRLTVMVYSGRSDHDLLVRCMRAGAREFLTEPLAASTVAEALVRASARRDEGKRPKKKATGQLFVFTGAKGGAGVTTVAANFGVALARYCGGKAALVDMELELGDAALTLGLSPKFSVKDGLEEVGRLDTEFFNALLTKHQSGLSVLAAPDEVADMNLPMGAVMKLVNLAREQFPFVVVDAGCSFGPVQQALFEAANVVYLVTQVSVADLRNANRVIRKFFSEREPGQLEVILNRFVARTLEIDEPAITKALTRQATWKIPNDYPAARKAQNTGIAMASADTQLAKVFADMARKASGTEEAKGKRKKFGLFG